MDLKEKRFIEKTLKSYENKEKSFTKLNELKTLDKKARRGANVFAYIFGSIGTLLLGVGMCIALGEILPEFFVFGIVIGVVGLIIASVNYLIYKKLLFKGKAKYAERIRELSNEILGE